MGVSCLSLASSKEENLKFRLTDVYTAIKMVAARELDPQPWSQSFALPLDTCEGYLPCVWPIRVRTHLLVMTAA